MIAGDAWPATRADGMSTPLFLSLNSVAIASEIRGARHSVCYAAPGIQPDPANAMAELARRIDPEFITVCLDFDENVMRMGFGDLVAVKTLRDAGIVVNSAPGLRTGLMVVDHQGYIFTQTALYLEAENRPTKAPNAMRLSKDQITEVLARLSPAAKTIAMAFAKTEEERQRIGNQSVEVQSEEVVDVEFTAVEKRLEDAPPVQFDIARQVRVFTAYLQYIEITLSGAAIQRHRLEIPPKIQKLGISEDIEGRLKTTFDLIKKGGTLTSKALDDKLNEIRKNFTRSLGKDHGRVVLKSARPDLEKRLTEFREELKAHQKKVESELRGHLVESRKAIVDLYLPRAVQNPPDDMRGQFLKISKDDARTWINKQLDDIFPETNKLIQKMQLDVRYKDVTFETLNRKDFLEAVKAAFPLIDWEKAHEEFQAAGERKE